MKLNLIKWRLMLTTVPVMVLVVTLKVILVKGFDFEGIVDFAEIGLVITGGIFLIGFMLAGTLADYKESEKIPSDMATTLESIEDTVVLAHQFKGDFDLQAQRRQLAELTKSIIDYFFHRETEQAVYAKLEGLTSIALFVENTRMGSTTSWIKREQTNLRKSFSRTAVIKRTHFISTGYAFLEVLTVVIIGLLLISRFENFIISMILVSFITEIFVYMVRLIKDIDHPFEYPVSGKVRAADIDLFPLVEYYERIRSRL
jgi:hypothetical protein